MSGKEITIQASDGGSFMGYLAMPESGPGAGVVVIQEIFGVNQVMREITDSWAATGFVALCPDIFWRQEPGIQLTDQTEAEWARAFELFNGFDLDKSVDDLESTAQALRGIDGCTGKVGSVGFCLGGRLAFLTATRTSIDAAVGYYGVMLPDHTGEELKAPVVLDIATEDEFVPKDQQAPAHASCFPRRRARSRFRTVRARKSARRPDQPATARPCPSSGLRQNSSAHVNNTSFAQYCEAGRVDYLGAMRRHLGIEPRSAIASVQISYLSQLHYPGNVRVGTRLLRLGNSLPTAWARGCSRATGSSPCPKPPWCSSIMRPTRAARCPTICAAPLRSESP